MIEIEDKLKGWFAKEVSPVSGQMVYSEDNMVFNFSSLKLDLVQYQVKDLKYDRFLDHVIKIFKIVSKDLGIKEYIRFGLRYWFLYPVESLDKGRKILGASRSFDISKDVEDMFGKSIKDTSIVMMLEKDKMGHRIALSVVHKKEEEISDKQSALLRTPPHKLPKFQKEALNAQLKSKQILKENPSVAILVDIDNYLDDPKAEYLETFIEEANSLTTQNVVNLIGG